MIKMNRLCRLCAVAVFALLARLHAADAVWIGATGSWNDPAMWQGGALPGTGDAAFFSGAGGTVTVPNGMPFSLSALTFNTNNLARNWTLTGETNTLTAPALCTVSNGNVYIWNALTGTDGLTKDGKGILCLNAPTNLFSGKVQSLNGDLFAETDRSLGLVPAAFEPDALTLNGGSLGNYTGLLTLHPNRGVTAGPSGAYLFGRSVGGGTEVAAPITGAGPLLIVQESAAVTLANPANDYAGGTVVGAAGPGIYANAGAQATLRLGADEVIPHGAGKGVLTLNGQRKAVLDLNGHSETVNTLSVTGDLALVNSAGAPGLLHAGLDNAGMVINGVIHEGATLDKIGSGNLSFFATGDSGGDIRISDGALVFATGSALGTTTFMMDGGSLAMTDWLAGLEENRASIPDGAIHLDAAHTASGVRPTTLMANAGSFGYPNYTQYRYAGHWHVPAAGTYSFAKAFDDGGYLAIDGIELLRNNSASAVAVTQNVALAAGWHTVDIAVSQGSGGVGPRTSDGFSAGIMFDPANGPFTNAAEVAASARRFEDPGDGSVLRTVPLGTSAQTVRARLELVQNATFDRSGTAAPLLWAGDLVEASGASGTPVLTVTGGVEPFRVGNPDRPAVFGIDVNDANGVVFRDKTWLLSLPGSSTWAITPGADMAAGTPGVLGTGAQTLTDYSLRIPRADALGTGGESVTVGGSDLAVWFDATRETGGRLYDDPDYAFTAAHDVTLSGIGSTVGFDGAGTVTHTGTISGTGTLIKNGDGDAALTGVNSFTGDIALHAGRLLVSEDAALGDSANTITLTDGTLGITGTGPLTLTRTLTSSAGVLDVSASVALTLDGALSGSLSKQGDGALTLGGTLSNSSLDLAVDEGVAILDKIDAPSVRHILRVAPQAEVRLAGSGGNQISGNVTLTGGTMDLNGASESVGRLDSAVLASTVTNSGATPATLTVGEGNVSSRFIGALADGAAVSGLTKTGTGTFWVAGAAGTPSATGGLRIEGGILVLGGGIRFIRFSPLQTRVADSQPSLAEFQLLRDGVPIPWPVGTSWNASSTSGTNNSSHVYDGNSRTFWQCGSAAGWVRVNLPAPLLFNGYRWYTGVNSANDPVAWTIDVSADAANWFTADTRTNQAAQITYNRGVLAGAYTLDGTAWPMDAIAPQCGVEIAAGATLTAQLWHETLGALSGAGAVQLDDAATLNVADLSIFTGAFTGRGRAVLGANAAINVPSLTDRITVIGGAADAVTVGANGERLFAAAVMDGASPVGLVKQGSGLTSAADAGSRYTGDTRVEQGTLAVQPNVWRFRYVRFNPTSAVNDGVDSYGFEMSFAEFQLLRNGQVVPYPSGTTATAPSSGTHTDDKPGNAINGVLSDRWLTRPIPNPLTIDTQTGITFDAYRWHTSTDAATPGRTPDAWSVEGSDDGVTWFTLDSRADVAFVGTGKPVGPYLLRPARFELPPEHWAATNATAATLAGVTAQYLRFTVHAARNEVNTSDFGSSGFSFAELRLMTNGAPVLYPAETTVYAPGGSYNSLGTYPFPPERVVDNDVSGSSNNRWYSDVMINPLVVNMGRPVSFDAYGLYTSYNVANRDPVSWTLEISNNKSEWHVIDCRTNETITTDRAALAGPWALDIPAGQLATDVIPDASRTRIAAGATLLLAAGALETVGPLSGTGTVALAAGASLTINAFEEAVFEGTFTGDGALAVSNGVQALHGAALDGVTNLVLAAGGILTGDATHDGDLAVSFAGGAYRGSIDVTGALSVAGDAVYALPEDADLPYTLTLFTYASADAATRTALAAGAETLSVPDGYVATVRVTDHSATLSVSAPGLILLLR